MIVSQFWLRIRWSKDYPAEDFEAMVTNLEPVALRFRFRFVATKVNAGPQGAEDETQVLRDKIELLSNFRDSSTLLAQQDWHRDGQLYATRCDVVIGPGETQRTGLASKSPMEVPGMLAPGVFRPAGVLRGHWELSLPIVRRPPPASQPKAQLGAPARVLIAAFHRMHQVDGSRLVNDNPWTLPLAAGRAEHFVPPDGIVGTTPVVATTTAKPTAARRRQR